MFEKLKKRLESVKLSPFWQLVDRKMKIKKLASDFERFRTIPVGEKLPDGTFTPCEISHSDFMELYRIAKAQQELLMK